MPGKPGVTVLMPVGEWNTARIIFKNGRVEHWLNGVRIIKFNGWNKEWQGRLQAKYPLYP